MPIVPSPPASETATASSCPASPPPIPAWTTGDVTPIFSSRAPIDLRWPDPRPSRRSGGPTLPSLLRDGGRRSGAPRRGTSRSDGLQLRIGSDDDGGRDVVDLVGRHPDTVRMRANRFGAGGLVDADAAQR